ncbi:hypothetical protein NC651_022731 [Populus alba x Populus x berolinensis]|jgi:hypothetical protein|nr:hypothetical protein NC651_022731 [Populus alba x Populus x berolinensis]
MTNIIHPFSLWWGKGETAAKRQNNSILAKTCLHMLAYYKETKFKTRKRIQFPFTFITPAGHVTTVLQVLLQYSRGIESEATINAE